MIQAAIFDLDGTLFDTREMILWQYERLSEEYFGQPLSRERIAREIHGTFEAIIGRILAIEDPAQIARALTRVHQLREASWQHFRLYDGLHDMLRRLSEQGVRVGVYTSSDHVTTDLIVRHGLADFITAAVNSEHVTQHKPHPEGFWLALRQLGTEPARAVMVGDMPSDIEMGKLAGAAKTIGVTHGFGTRASLQAAAADHIVDSLDEIVPLL